MEKPLDPADAKRMLQSLSGRSNTVFTGVTLITPGVEGGSPDQPLVHTFSESTQVSFAHLSERVIDCYVASGEPMDKAGAYGYQGPLGSSLITRIEGDYFCVVGFPVHAFARELAHLIDVDGWLRESLK